MSWEYSENILVQESAGSLLQDVLKWDEVVYAYNKEILGEDGTLGRRSYKEIVLTRYLRKALLELNDWLTEELCNDAIKDLLAYAASDTLLKINQSKYEMLREVLRLPVKSPMEKRKNVLQKCSILTSQKRTIS